MAYRLPETFYTPEGRAAIEQALAPFRAPWWKFCKYTNENLTEFYNNLNVTLANLSGVASVVPS